MARQSEAVRELDTIFAGIGYRSCLFRTLDMDIDVPVCENATSYKRNKYVLKYDDSMVSYWTTSFVAIRRQECQDRCIFVPALILHGHLFILLPLLHCYLNLFSYFEFFD